MICERCGEVAETFVTEGHGELGGACQKEVQQEDRRTKPPGRTRAAEEV